MTEEQMIKSRNQKIAILMRIFNCGYAHAAHLLYCINNAKI